MDEIEIDIRNLLFYLPAHGPYTSGFIQFVNKEIPNERDIDFIESNGDTVNESTRIWRYHILFIEQEVIDLFNYLVREGFAIYRFDILRNNDYKRTIELTKEGRKLKELGTIKKYNEYALYKKYQRRKAKMLLKLQMYVIIIVSVVAVPYYISEVVCHHFHNLSFEILTCLFLYLAGIMTAIMIYLIMMVIYSRLKTAK